MIDVQKRRYLTVEKITMSGDAVESELLVLDRNYLGVSLCLLEDLDLRRNSGFRLMDEDTREFVGGLYGTVQD